MIAFEFNGLHRTCRMLNNVTKMDVRSIDKDGHPILQLVDHNLPEVLKSFENDYLNINNILKNNTPNSYYYYINSYDLQYIAAGIWENGSFSGFISIGPFISSIPVAEFISNIIYKNSLPISERNTLQEFYNSLSMISSNDSNNIGDLLVNQCSHTHIDSQLITPDIIKPILDNKDLKLNIAEGKNIIEFRYKQEKTLFNAVAKGDKDEINRISKELNSFLTLPDRVPESPIRSAKNLLFVLNTLCRIASEKGGVHPIYIHNISEKFAIMIEKSPNLPYLQKLMFVMLNEYCDLVKMFSTNDYSPIVKNAVDHINLNLGNELTLKSIADTIHVNASHLSRKFKIDTGMTVIDYINQKRVEEAKLYLERGNTSITEIALMVGFNDLNYFGRVFKKITSLTPSEYVKSKKL